MMPDGQHEEPEEVFPVWHFCAKFEEELDYSEDKEDGQHPHFVGIFSTRERAVAVVEHCRNLPGFRDWPESFKIYRLPLERDAWETGFFRYWEDEE